MSVAASMSEQDARAAMFREIHHDVRALAGRDRQPVHGHRRGQKALIRSDLPEGRSVVEGQEIEPRVGSVQHAETVLAGLHIQIQAVDLPLTSAGVSDVFGDPGSVGEFRHGIVDLPVACGTCDPSAPAEFHSRLSAD